MEEEEKDYVDSVGMANVERFEKMYGTTRGIWLSLDQLLKLKTELEIYEHYEKDQKCSAVGFMVGIGEDFKYNVEVIPLYGEIKDVNNPAWGEYEEGGFKAFDYETQQEYLDLDADKKIKKTILTGAVKRRIYRKTWIDGGFLIRNLDNLEKNERLVKDGPGEPIVGKYEKPVRGLYNGSIQVTHEVSHNEAQRFPPPPSQ